MLVEINAGATTDFAYRIDLVPNGGSPSLSHAVATLDAAVRNDQAYGANLRWLSPSELLIECLRDKGDTVLSRTAIVAGDTVRVSVRPGVVDSTAPPGGMLYNLRRRKS